MNLEILPVIQISEIFMVLSIQLANVVNFTFSSFKVYRLSHESSGKCQINLLGELLDSFSPGKV